MDLKAVGERIRQQRKIKGLTQEELAKAVNLSTMSIRRYEKGERIIPEGTLHRLATALNVDISELLTPAQGIEAMKQFFREGNEAAQIVVNISKKHGLSLNAAEKIVKDVAWEYRDEFHTTQEGELREAVAELNDAGRQEVFDCAIRRAGELTEIPKYQKENEPPQDANAAPEGQR